MANQREFEFLLLRYVPDAVKEEFVNIGVVMFEPGADGQGFADVRFRRDWRRVWCLDPAADVEMLEAMEREIRMHLVSAADRETLVRRMQDSFSNLIQVSLVKGCLAENPAEEIEAVAKIYFESPIRTQTRMITGRESILQSMQTAFDQAGISQLLMQGIPVSVYTKAGDSFKIDFGYHNGNTLKFFHAVSLRRSVDQAVNLAYRFPKIEAGVLAMKQDSSALTAVVDDGLDRNQEQVQFALGMMEEARIRIASAAEMPAIAEAARRELMG